MVVAAQLPMEEEEELKLTAVVAQGPVEEEATEVTAFVSQLLMEEEEELKLTVVVAQVPMEDEEEITDVTAIDAQLPVEADCSCCLPSIKGTSTQ